MKKANPYALAPQHPETPETGEELARVVPIRTETTLTRYPIHRIAKRAKVLIKETKTNQRGKVETTWEVRNPPGPLAYKLDTLIINRRFDELRTRGEIPQLIKLGSLREICEELEINPNGKATNAIKEALCENAFAGITCNLDFTGNDGTKREFEFNTTRYTVIFTGEKLPDEKRADAVYIELHPRFHEMLKHSKTRPLDYKYLRGLAPAPQRLYELLSFAMFGTLTHGRPNAQMVYSEFCQSAPLTRHYETRKMHSQMWKIHRPHIDAGYIKAVEFQETTDPIGAIDWLIKYTPGRRARYEFREFTTKRLVEQEPKKPRLVTPPTKNDAPSPAPTPTIDEEGQRIITALMKNRITESEASRLVKDFRHAAKEWAEAFDYQPKDKIKNLAGWLITAIESDYPRPEGYESARAAREEIERKKAKKAAVAACHYCKESHVTGMRFIKNKENPRGAYKPCTHNPEIEDQYEAAD
jgi:hypothetical protein